MFTRDDDLAGLHVLPLRDPQVGSQCPVPSRPLDPPEDPPQLLAHCVSGLLKRVTSTTRSQPMRS